MSDHYNTFNPTLVQFKLASRPGPPRRAVFQSYLSPIQTTSALMPPAPGAAFQSYLSPIQTCRRWCRGRHNSCFQSYLSPIQTSRTPATRCPRSPFQSYLSPIQTGDAPVFCGRPSAFNPTLVQFKRHAPDLLFGSLIVFQSYLSPIQTEDKWVRPLPTHPLSILP